MFSNKSILQMLFVFFAVLMLSSTAAASPFRAATGTGFTYQGKLSNGGAPANGIYDFEFNLFDALSGGTQKGSLTQGDVTVSAGLFTVQLDFGNVFDGAALYLEIGVRPGASTSAYTALSPRHSLSATPYASYASKAPWTGLTGVPSGFADGVDNGSSYQNVRVVAKSGGDFTSIQAALDSITDASAANPYLIHVAPGVYSETVTMKAYVDIEGSGELTTKITYVGSGANSTGTVLGANNAELRFLTVENTGGNTYAYAIYNNASAPRLTHISASATGGTDNYGVYNNSSSPTMTNVTASASGGRSNIGVYNNTGSSPTMANVTASASGGTVNIGVLNEIASPTMANMTISASGGTDNFGVYNHSSSPTMTNVTASATGGLNNIGVNNIGSSPTMTNVTASATGGVNNTGVLNSGGSSPTMANMTASATGGTNNYGVENISSSPTMANVTASATGGTNSNYGVYNFSSSSPTINNSVITGSTSTIRNNAVSTTRVGASQLNGGVVYGGGMTCVGAYNASYVALSGICE